MFLNIIDLLNYYIVKKYFLFLIFCPLEFFEKITFIWVLGSSHWFLDQNNFLILFLHFAPRGTTNNLLLLNTQNRPTPVYSKDEIIIFVWPRIKWSLAVLGTHFFRSRDIYSIFNNGIHFNSWIVTIEEGFI